MARSRGKVEFIAKKTLPEFKLVKRWIKPHYIRVNGKRVFVRGHYRIVKIRTFP